MSLVIALISGAAVAATLVLHWMRDLPSAINLDEYNLQATSKIVDAQGQVIGKIPPLVGKATIDRDIVDLKDISPAATAAIVFSEDNRFFEHAGFDPIGIARAVYQTVFKNNAQGGSTLTQELVRNTILDDTRRTPERKIKEVLVSVQVERYFTKQEILHTYLNAAFWGGSIHGIARAARAYFGKPPRDLTLAEGVYLASLLPGPNTFYADFESAREGMCARLNAMADNKWITESERDAALAEKLVPNGWSVQWGKLLKPAPKAGARACPIPPSRLNGVAANVSPAASSSQYAYHFKLQVRKELQSILGDNYRDLVFKSGGLNIFTTLQPVMQSAAEATVDKLQAKNSGLRLPVPGMQIGLASIDPYSGEVQALIGGMPDASGRYTDYDRATMSSRSPGSSIKPILYATAIEKGAQEWTTFDDKPVSFPDPSQPGGVWTPKNFDGPKAYRNGPVSMRYALDHSLNLPTVRVGQYVGMSAFADKLRLLNFPNVPAAMPWAATIGGLPGGTNPLVMSAAYATFVNGGVYHAPHVIRRVTNLKGDKVYYQAPSNPPTDTQIWSKQAAFVALDLLRGVVNDPPSISGNYANAARLPGRALYVGGKTGTSSDQKDLWFVGVTPELSAAVWIGFDDFGARVPDSVYSGVYAPPVWAAYAKRALRDRPVTDYSAYRSLQGVSFRTAQGVRMAAAEFTQPEKLAPIAATSVTLPTPPTSIDPPAAGGSQNLVVLDICQDPPVLADENTPVNCAAERRIDPADLYRYAPQPGSASATPGPTGATTTPGAAGTAGGAPGGP